jgi:hypothetical protein
MAEPSWPEQVDLSAYVSDLDAVQLKIRVPAPVIVLLADLKGGVSRRVGLKSSGELLAAVLVHAAANRAALADLVGDYRETQVHQLVVTDETDGMFDLARRADLDLT